VFFAREVGFSVMLFCIAVCMIQVRLCTALSSSSFVFKEVCREIFLSSSSLKASQLTGPRTRKGEGGFGNGDSLSVKRTGEWSDDKP